MQSFLEMVTGLEISEPPDFSMHNYLQQGRPGNRG